MHIQAHTAKRAQEPTSFSRLAGFTIPQEEEEEEEEEELRRRCAGSHKQEPQTKPEFVGALFVALGAVPGCWASSVDIAAQDQRWWGDETP